MDDIFLTGPDRDIVLVDMDAVLTDFDAAFVKKWLTLFPGEPCPVKEAQDAFANRTRLPKRLHEKVTRVYLSPDLFSGMTPMPGASSALTEMRRCGLEPYICTAPMPGHLTCLTEKHAWVKKHMPRFIHDRLIISMDKTLVKGRWLIDDLPHVRGAIKPDWQQIIFSAPYNASVSDLPRLHCWPAWKQLFASLYASVPART